MMVPAIEEGYLNRRVPERAGGIQAAKPTANNYDVHSPTILDLDKAEVRPNGTCLAGVEGMTMPNRIARWAGARFSRRVSRSLPWVGAAVAIATVASTMRRKGVISGALDTGLNSMPFVGAAKNIAEVVRGRDFFPDRYGVTKSPRP